MRRWILAVIAAVVGLAFVVTAQQSATAADAGTIRGTVTGTGGAKVQSAAVYAYAVNGGASGSGFTDSQGNYSISLAPGQYKLDFYATGYAEEYYDNKSDSSSADPVTVTSSQATTANAALELPGTISGTVRGSDDIGLSGAQVDLYRSGNEYSYWTAYADGEGKYSFTSLPPGTYKLRFRGASGTPWFAEFWNDKATLAEATGIAVTSGATKTADATLAKGPQIRGKVTNDAGGAVQNGYLILYRAGSNSTAVDYIYPDATGAFASSALPAGDYVLYCSGTGVVTRYYNNKRSFSDADKLTVGASDVTANPVLQRSGGISGILTGPDGNPVSGWWVSAALSTPDGSSTWSATTGQDGTYSLSSLEPGSYTVRFSKPYNATDEYAPQWYKAARTKETSTAVVVESAKTATDIDAQLWNAGSIAGTVTDATGNGVAGITVSAMLYSAQTYTVVTAADGTYRIPGVEDGSYKVWFTGPAGSTWITEYYNDTTSYYEATALTMANSQALTGIDAQLTEGALLSGKVSASTGSLSNVYVSIRDKNDNTVASAYTDGSGNWSVPLTPGTYWIRFSPNSPYLAEYWDDAPGFGSAKSVTVAAGETKSGLNATLDRGGSISGTVSVDRGSFTSAYVYATNLEASSSYVGYVYQNGGSYTIAGLPAGTYRLYFSANGFIPEYWDDKPDANSATTITVAKSQDVTGKNAVLDRGAVLTGKLVDSKKAPVKDARVSLRSVSGATWVSTSTAADGAFSLGGLPAGSYVMDYAPGYFSQDRFIPEYYLHKTQNAADRITLAKNEDKALPAIAVTRFSTLAGTVKDTGGKTLSGVSVEAYNGQNQMASARTDGTGKYSLPLLSGTYRLRLSPPGGSAASRQWWDASTSIYGAKKIPVGAEQAVTADLVMRNGASIAGTVTAANGDRLAGVSVKAAGPEGSYTATTGADGTYAVTGLAPAKYAVSFNGGSQYFKQWYNGEPTRATADLVSVGFGESKAGIDARLADSPYVMGTITAGGAPVPGASVELYESNSGVVAAYTSADGSGVYRTKPVPPGKYDLHVSGNSDVIGQWYVNAEVRSDATTVVVAKDKPTVADVALRKGGRIEGTVTRSTGPVPGAWVTIDGDAASREGYTDADGKYSLGGLPTGDYTVHVWPSFGNNDLVSQYYSGKYDEASADKVRVTTGATVPGIDFALSAGSSISGKVTTADGQQHWPWVAAYRKNASGEFTYFSEDEASTDGSYTVSSLPAGDYKLVAHASGYQNLWWTGKKTLEAADTITVAATPLTGRDFALTVAGPGISGKIATADGQPLNAGSLELLAYRYYPDGGYQPLEYSVAQDGSFRLNLSAGKYKIAVHDYSGRYARQYWNGKDTLDGADFITVGDDLLTGKDFVLTPALTLSGSVTFPAGVTTDVTVVLRDADGLMGYQSVSPSAPTFRFPVRRGTYTLSFSGADVVTEWWQDQASQARATPITVTDKDVSGLVALLSSGAKISGTVTDAGNQPLPARVSVIDADSGETVEGAHTDPDGRYAADSLPGGRYLVRFDPDGTDYSTQWFSGAARRSSATVISLGSSGTATADARLTAGSILTGAVTDQVGNPVAGAPVTVEDLSGHSQGTALTNVRGIYTVRGLEEDSYRVRAQPPNSRLDLLPEWYKNAAKREGATPVDVPAAQTTSVNFGLEQGATVSGTVRGPSGTVAKGIGVDLFDAQGEKSLTAWTDSDGTYRSTALEPGMYKVRFQPGYYGGKGMVQRWWRNQETMASSTALAVKVKEQVVGIDATLGFVGNAVAPSEPTAVTAVAGDGKATVSWREPASNGGLPITKYEVFGSPRANGCVTYGALSCEVALQNDRPYTFVVRASTDAGRSPLSAASTAVTPVSGKPKAPTSVVATAGVQSATVRWTPGAGAPATGFTATSWPHNKTCTSTSDSCVVSGLTAGQAYTFTVVASNLLGDSPASAASSPVTPAAPPGDGGGGDPTPPPVPQPPDGGGAPPAEAGPGGGGTIPAPPAPPAPPAAVSGAKAKIKGRKVAVTWKPVAGATSYQVRAVKGKKASPWKTVSGPAFKAKFKKGSYVLEIKAVGPGGTGPAIRVTFKTK